MNHFDAKQVGVAAPNGDCTYDVTATAPDGTVLHTEQVVIRPEGKKIAAHKLAAIVAAQRQSPEMAAASLEGSVGNMSPKVAKAP